MFIILNKEKIWTDHRLCQLYKPKYFIKSLLSPKYQLEERSLIEPFV